MGALALRRDGGNTGRGLIASRGGWGVKLQRFHAMQSSAGGQSQPTPRSSPQTVSLGWVCSPDDIGISSYECLAWRVPCEMLVFLSRAAWL